MNPMSLLPLALTADGTTTTAEAVQFWIIAPLVVLGALGLIFAKKTVYAAISIVFGFSWLGIATMVVEILGGAALILGIGTRIVSAALVPVLLGAAVTAHWGNGFGWSNPNGGWEYPVMWAAVQAFQHH